MHKKFFSLLLKKLTYLCCLVVFIQLLSTNTSIADAICRNSNILGGKLLTNICWRCFFPIRVAGITIVNDGSMPDGAVKNPFCLCKDKYGVYVPGFVTSFWEPFSLIEFQRTPGCSSVLGGITLPFGVSHMFRGTHGNTENDASDLTFTHYRYYAFPLMAIMSMFSQVRCMKGQAVDLDLLYISELDPTWNREEVAFFQAPESAAVANPIAVAACAADAISSIARKPQENLFWCAGTWGHIYPLAGKAVGENGGIVEHTSLFKARILAALHRRGTAKSTIGKENMCEGNYSFKLPKRQYKFTLVHPLPETKRGHYMGESVLTWGGLRIIPGIGEDLIYLNWRWNDCCVSPYGK